ncbi:hypothetical protein P7L88_01780 [Bisgaard Taxon 10/6]|uniref:RipA family octameric membrane protein n=1 Tax=Exercitatus varius TaxID=67857 RepID=UPI00294B2D01|nr:hypothetical protein [Exercitatus varius]MDG2947269.1 hypothetical protein [Exercitatus varius]
MIVNHNRCSKKSPSEDRLDNLKRIYERCIETRNFEITQLIQRNNFFILFQGALFTGLTQLGDKKELLCIVILLGIIMSFFQIFAAAGAKFWQQYWESKLDQIETKLEYSMKENGVEDFVYLFKFEQELKHSDVVKESLNKSLKDSKCRCFDKAINFLINYKFSVSRIPIYIYRNNLFTWVGGYMEICYLIKVNLLYLSL